MYEGRSSGSSSGGGGMSAATVVMIVFIILKLVGVEPIASWSWGFVIFVPFLVSFAIFFGAIFLLVSVLGVFAGGGAVSNWSGRRRMAKMMREVEKEEAKEAEEKTAEEKSG